MGHSQMMAESSCFNLWIIFQGGTRGGGIIGKSAERGSQKFSKKSKASQGYIQIARV